MSRRSDDRDAVVGAITVMLAIVGFSAIYIWGADRHAPPSGYRVQAAFGKLEGVAVGSPVRLSGVPVGKVIDVKLAPDFSAVTTLVLNDNVKLPVDSAASIRTDGLLGGKYIDIQPGGQDAVMVDGDRISLTQDSMSVEDLLELVIREAKAKKARQADGCCR